MKALVVVGDGLKDYGDLLVIGKAEATCLFNTRENVNVKDIIYSAKYKVHVLIFEAREQVVADQLNDRKVKKDAEIS